MIAALLGLAVAAEPWAESPGLLAKATDPSFFAVVSMPVLLHRDLWDPSPRPGAGEPSPGNRWMGLEVPSLEPRTRDSLLRGGFGNEVGDQLFREEDRGDPENRTPAMWLFASSPRFRGWRARAWFDQVDHFSDRTLDVRVAAAGSPPVGGRKRAFFGDNLPDQSFAGGGVDGAFDGGAAAGAWARTGWVWLPSAGSRMLGCWRTTTAAVSWEGERMGWTHAQGWFDRADTSSAGVRQARGTVRLSAAVGRNLSASAGVDYGSVRRSGEVGWRPSRAWDADPWLRLRLGKDGWSLGGFHQAGTSTEAFRDTLSWEGAVAGGRLRTEVWGGWQDRPDGGAYEDSSAAGIVRMDCRVPERSLGGRLSYGFPLRDAELSMDAAPWLLERAHAFQPDRFDTLRGGWVVRSGREIALPGTLVGCKARAAARWKVAAFASLDASAQVDPVFDGPRDRTDLRAPLWGTSLGADLSHPSGLSVRPLLLWRASSSLRHLSERDWTVPAGPDLSVWVEQSWWSGRLVMSCAALNILSDDPVEAPGASEDRFRLLVQVSARVP